MQPAIAERSDDRRPVAAQFPPLYAETREVVPTDCAAYHTNRKPQTLRVWACTEAGPIRPIRINGRLGWRIADIRRLLQGQQK
ncbi:MAG: hypothetical protein ROZ64_03455 [Burkholderiaceae bacterium]|jgi:hypothetical protein|nr:hypothetical protein [Burkholderiaceae bacterium]